MEVETGPGEFDILVRDSACIVMDALESWIGRDKARLRRMAQAAGLLDKD